VTTLAEACADLRPLLPVARDLLTEPDQQGSAGHAQPASTPPWNQAAANAVFDIHAAVRAVELDLRYEVTGTGEARGGSDANTVLALDAIAAFETAVTAVSASVAAGVLARLADAVLMLPAVDLEERPQRVRAPCPYCGRLMLRLLPRKGAVTCVAFGSCADSDGRHPVGRIGRSLDGSAVIEWADGLVT
jgi:hypothetical protein